MEVRQEVGARADTRITDALAVPPGRALGWLYVVGASTAMTWLALPHAPARADGVVLVMAVLAMLLGSALACLGRRVPDVLLHAALGTIQLVIAVAYLAGREPGSDVRLFFLWATPYAALYWSLRAATAHLGWTSAVVLGCLALMPAATHREAAATGLMLLTTLAATAVLTMTAATALRRAVAAQRHDATHDALTGLGNRRMLLEALHAEARTGRGRALVLLDLDGFKAVNDRHGHAAGDALLRDIGRLLAQAVRSGDLACRLGGDEFALLVHGVTDAEQALALAASAIRATSAAEVGDAPGLVVGASAGVRMLTPGLDGSRALRDADAALYAAKRGGRAGALLWTDGGGPQVPAQRVAARTP